MQVTYQSDVTWALYHVILCYFCGVDMMWCDYKCCMKVISFAIIGVICHEVWLWYWREVSDVHMIWCTGAHQTRDWNR